MMLPTVISSSTCLSEDATASSVTRVQDFCSLNPTLLPVSSQQPQKIKKRRNLPGNPDPDAEVVALSPNTLLATNRFICEICNKGFQRDQNLQLHRRGHNLPWKLKQKNTKDNKKRAYVCPEPTCVHHNPSRALGDLTGIKKHYCRKHGEKKWKCEKCSKIYAVQSDWKAHAKTCGTREYRCDCGTLFSRKDSFLTHRAFCDALAEESARQLSANSIWAAAAATTNATGSQLPFHLNSQCPPPSLFTCTTQQLPNIIPVNPWIPSPQIQIPNSNIHDNQVIHIKPESIHFPISSPFYPEPPPPPKMSVPPLSATALLQKASTVGANSMGHVSSTMSQLDTRNISHVTMSRNIPTGGNIGTWQKSSDRLTRDFMGLTGEQCGGMGNGKVDVNVNVNMRGVLSFTGSLEFPAAVDLPALGKYYQSFGFPESNSSETWKNC